VMGGRVFAPWRRLLLALRAGRVPLAVIVLYLVLRALFDRLTEGEGLLSPGGSPHLEIVGLGVVVLALRLTTVLLLPGILTYQLVLTVLGWTRNRTGRQRSARVRSA
jgi:hypothetical protein